MEEELKNLFNLWKEKDIHSGKIFNFDGIVCKDEWDKQDKKILFLLKEAYHDDKKFMSENQSNEYNLTYDLCENGPWNNIWNRVAEWTYGILNTSIDDIAAYKKLSKEEAKSYVKKISVMNIKKSGGESKSKDESLRLYAENDAAEIVKEIELINPNIIICGYTMGYLILSLETLKKNDSSVISINKEANFSENFHYNWKNRIVLDYYHPAARYPALLSYYGLIGSYKDALRNK